VFVPHPDNEAHQILKCTVDVLSFLSGTQARLPFPASRLSLRSLFLPAAAIALVSQLAVLWAVIAGRAPASSRRPSARWAEIVWVVLPTLALLAVLWATWSTIHSLDTVRSVTGVPA